MKNKIKGYPLLRVLLVMGTVPLLSAAIIMIVISSLTIKREVENETFDKLEVAAEGVKTYFEYDIRNDGDVDYKEYSDHEYIQSAQNQKVELTLFKDDTRLITSLKNEDGSYNEGTKASEEVYEIVKKGETYTSNDVVINGVDYYVFYQPIYDNNGKFWGMAFAGTTQKTVESVINASIIKLIGTASIVAIIFGVIIILIALKIRKNISMVAESLTLMSEGDMSKRIDITDMIREITSIINASNVLQEKMTGVINEVKNNSNSLMCSIESVQISAAASAEGTEQIAGAMEELTNSTLVLSERVQNVNTQTINMGEHIQGIADNVQALSSASDDIKNATERAQILMAKVLESSDQSADATVEISQSITETNESIVKITEAVDFISEIASQTNLLSLNASIEAARAGEAGRGFAVVAEEIGKLATDSAETANKIRELANDMNDKSSKTVKLAGKIGTIVSEEKENVGQTQEAFDSLGASIEEGLALIAQIDYMAEELSSLKVGIMDNISDLSAVSEENAASNEEVTASVTNISERVTDVSAQSDAMKEISENLQTSIAYFK